MLKKICSNLLLSMCLILGFAQVTSAHGSSSFDFMTNIEKEAKMLEIDEKYEVGEILSDKDAEFIIKYAQEAEQEADPGTITINAKKNFNGSKYVSGMLVSVSGTCDVNVWNPLKNRYSCDVYGQTNKGKVKAEYTHTAYGYLGKDKKVGKIFTKTHKTGYNTGLSILSASHSYVGFVVYAHGVAKATATYGNTIVEVIHSDKIQ